MLRAIKVKTQEISDWDNHCNRPGDHYCNMISLFPLLKNAPADKLKSTGIFFSAEISRYPNVDCVVWLLVIMHRQVYNNREQMGHKNAKCKVGRQRRS